VRLYHRSGQTKQAFLTEEGSSMKVDLGYSKPSSKTWKVKGQDAETLFKNLNKNAFWGRYRSNESARFSGKSAKIDLVKVAASPTITMPVWSDYPKAPKEAKASWDKMWKALKKHEDNHHTIFDDAAKALKKSLEKNGDLDEKDVSKAWGEFLKATKKSQESYDTRTKHGKSEGVILDQW
jgi:predicted secreted Zn-dependent protease